MGLTLDDPIDANELFIPIHDLRKYVKVHKSQDINNLRLGYISSWGIFLLIFHERKLNKFV